MNRDDVIRMAREAGLEQDGDNFFSPSHEEIDVHITDLERFAALVLANNPPQSSMAWQEGYAAGAVAEREAFPDLTAVINWLENGCDPKEAAKELRLYAAAISARRKA